jgi:hypothetical protein
MNRPEHRLLYLSPENAAVFKLDAGSGLIAFLTFSVHPTAKKVPVGSSSA